MAKYDVPADVPNELIDTFIDNMDAATAGTGRMNLFACDQKIEHLNDDFYIFYLVACSVNRSTIFYI